MATPIGRLSHIVVDCNDPDRLAAFWTAALGVDVQMRWRQYVLLRPQLEGGPALAFQQVPEPRQGKNRLHLDLAVPDLAPAVAQVQALGGTVLHEVDEGGLRLTVMADPEGNELCLVLQPEASPG